MEPRNAVAFDSVMWYNWSAEVQLNEPFEQMQTVLIRM